MVIFGGASASTTDSAFDFLVVRMLWITLIVWSPALALPPMSDCRGDEIDQQLESLQVLLFCAPSAYASARSRLISCTVGWSFSQEAKLSADLSASRSIGRRVSKSTSIEPYL